MDTTRFFTWWFLIQCSALQNPLKTTGKERRKLFVIKTISLHDFPMHFQRDTKSARPWRGRIQRSENFLVLEGTDIFDAVQSFLPLFATYGETQSIQENQLWNVTVSLALPFVTVSCQRTQVGLKPKQTRSVNELQKNTLFQNLEDRLTLMLCSEYYTPQKLVEERMCLYTIHSGSHYHLIPLPSMPNSSSSPYSPPKNQS